MNDKTEIIERIEKGIQKLQDEYEETIRRKEEIEKKLRNIETTLELDKGALIKPSIEETPSFQSTRFKGKSGLEAYKDLLINDFLNKPFKEKDIRELATSEGLRIKKKPIKEITSRSIIAQFVENGLLERIDRGLYKSIIKAAPLNLTSSIDSEKE